mmetsp:Transcript_15172/g.34462  ORF Transcript_15172/g.34462 Transcript_15172/m.34462 type:complete len:1026 (-) Transcript_15172:113-3190(-)
MTMKSDGSAKVHPEPTPVSPFGLSIEKVPGQPSLQSENDLKAILEEEKRLQEIAEKQQEGEAIKEDLDNIKIATLQRMISHVIVKENDAERVCPFLYLTNSQIQNMQNPTMSPEKMSMLRKSLEVDKYESCMILMPCKYGSFYSQQFPFRTEEKTGGRFPTQRPPELDEVKQEQADHQLLMLAKLILDVAMESKALVVGNENCDLMSAFARVSAPMLRKMGRATCPFGILVFARAPSFQWKAAKGAGKVGQFHKQSPSWTMSDDIIQRALAGKYGDDEAFWPHSDLPSGEYTLVMFESMDEGSLEFETGSRFKDEFTTALAQDKTTIALQTYGSPKLEEITRVKDHACSSGLPLLLLDSRVERSHREAHVKMKGIKTIAAAETVLNEFREQLHTCPRGARMDTYNTSMLAFVKSVIGKVHSIEYGDDLEQGESKQRHMLLWQAIDDKKKERDKARRPLSKSGIQEGMTPYEQELIHATNLVMNYVGGEIEWECLSLIARYREGMDEIMTAVDWDDFRDKLGKNWIKLLSCCFHQHSKLKRWAAGNGWCELRDLKKSTSGGRFQLAIVDNPPPDVSFDAAKDSFFDFVEEEFSQDKAYKSTQTEKQFAGDEHKWLAVWDVLGSSNVETGNMFDLVQVKKKMEMLAQIETLPSSNMLQTLVLIRRAWVLHDVYHEHAWRYKKLAKLSYMLILFIGITTVIVTVAYGLIEKEANENLQRVVLLALALVATLVTGLTSLVDPNRKWMFLRCGQLWLEQEIWKLRTRTGDYMSLSSSMQRQQSEMKATENFADFLTAVQERVQQGADLKNTSFYSIATSTDNIYSDRFNTEGGAEATDHKVIGVQDLRPQKPLQPPKPSWLSHGQYSGIKFVGMKGDNGHSPTTPDEYIRYRLTPALNFYQSRIPRYNLERKAIQLLLLCTSILSAGLASFELSDWTAIVAAFAAAFAAWQEFTQLLKKLERYSQVSHGLQDVLMRWQSLEDAERQQLKHLEDLVQSTEELISSEHSSWLSDAKLAKATAQVGQEDKKGK